LTAEARAFFERVGATPFLARLDAALVRESAASPSSATRTAVGPSGLEEAVSEP
jgi:hypothetical protein